MDSKVDIDVCDISTLLHCVGFKMKSLETFRLNSSQDSGLARTIVLTCHASGTQIVMESFANDCSCPPSHDDSSFYQVSGVSRGIELNKETGSAYMDALPRNSVNFIKEEMSKMIQLMRSGNNKESSRQEGAEGANNAARASLQNIVTTPPRESNFYLKPETPTRYRSLDTLTALNLQNNPELPEPGKLSAKGQTSSDDLVNKNDILLKKKLLPRQDTYSLESDVCSKTRTSSPIKTPSEQLLNRVKYIEFMVKSLAEDLENGGKGGTCMDRNNISLNLDVSKISITKCSDPPKFSQYKSSPNLSNMDLRTNGSVSKLKRGTSIPKQAKPKLAKGLLSPNIQSGPTRRFDVSGNKASPAYRSLDYRINRAQSLKATYLSPAPATSGQLANCSSTSSKKKNSLYSHVKSTIPRPSFLTKKDDKSDKK